MHVCGCISFCNLVVVINFNQSTYSVNESDISVQPGLILSNPSVFDIILEIRDINTGLTGINTHKFIDHLTKQVTLYCYR